jgi:hypothetical protein
MDRFTEDFSFWWHTFLVSFRYETLFNIPEKHPVQDKVDDQQRSKYQACIVMHGYPLIAGDIKVR